MADATKELMETSESPILEEEETQIVRITIVTPAKDEVKFSVSPNELIPEIRQYLADEIATCVYTNYHFELGGKAIKEEPPQLNAAIPELKDELVLTMVEDSYNDIESRTQVARLRDLLQLSQRHANEPPMNWATPDIVFEGMKADNTDSLRDNPLLSSYHISTQEATKCFRSLSYSGFNPPPPLRRLMGDFYYLDFVPVEPDLASVVICANTRGFYVTQSKQGKFNPSAATSKPCHATTLVGCLSAYSPKFKKCFEEVLKVHQARSALEYGEVALPPRGWLAKTSAAASKTSPAYHEFDLGRAELDLMKFTETAVTSMLQGRDWNEEMQLAREMPRSSVQERIERDRNMYRIHVEYVEAATHSAMAIFNGQIQPLNFHDPPTSWIYVHNNIFFTQAVDMRGVYADCGGDETFEKALKNDLVALKRFNETDPEDLYALDNVLITYCGKTLFAQTIVPGLFNGLVSGETTVCYGSLESGVIAAKEEVHEKLGKVAASLYLKEHKVASSIKDSGEGDEKKSETSVATLWTSADVKGIIGSDSRTYLLDMGHLFPRDGNYASDKHPSAVFRPELLQAYVTRQWYLSRMKVLHEKKASLLKAKAEAEEKGEKFEFPADLNLPEIPVPVLALNPDLYVKGVTLADEQSVIDADKKLNSTLARFLTDECIPLLVNDWASSAVPLPIDSETLVSVMHAKGINMRYLGTLAKVAVPLVPAMRDILYREMVVRAAQTVFRRLVKKVAPYSMAEFVVSFLNTFFDKISTVGQGSRSGVKPAHLTEAQATAAVNAKDDEFGLSHHSLWVSIRQLVESKYHYTLPEFIPAGVFDLATLRTLCLRLGVKVEAKNYDFNKDAPFELSNLVEMVPVVKHVTPSSRDGTQITAAARALIADGKAEDGMDVLQEAVSLYHQCFGPMHREIGNTLSSLALLAFQKGDIEQAVDYMERAVFIHERKLGQDHHETIHSYGNLAMMANAEGRHQIALNYLRRALYMGVIAAGWYHPENANTYVNIAVVMHDLKQYKESLVVLNKAQKIVDAFITQSKDSSPEVELAINAVNLQTSAGIAHLQAIAHAGLNNFREALAFEKKNYNLLKQMRIPEDDPRMAEANSWLHELTRRAVEAEKANKSALSDVSGGRLGPKKGVNTKVLQTALNKASTLTQAATAAAAAAGASTASPSIAAAIKRPGRNPNQVIGKGVATSSTTAATSSSSSNGVQAKASPSASSSSTGSKKGKKGASNIKSTSPNASSAPVPDLL